MMRGKYFVQSELKALLTWCSEIDFGPVTLSESTRRFRSELDREILSFCTSLPESTQADALAFLSTYMNNPFGADSSFFSDYYAPSWTIIYWIIQYVNEVTGAPPLEVSSAKTAHSMAMFLHSFDDHLSDGELPTSHLALLLRSQSWIRMTAALSRLGRGIEGGLAAIREFINDYYSSITCSHQASSLEAYCALFRKRMATSFCDMSRFVTPE